jgi:DNA-binding GntR family transcriptional regulator
VDNKLEESLVFHRSTTQDNVVDQLRRLILSHYFKPNERLLQNHLAELLGVSRTPVREALVKLASEGLVVFSPYKGASVVDFSIEDLNEIYSVRIALESYAAYLAAQRITEKQLDHLRDLLTKMSAALIEGDQHELLQLNRRFHFGIYSAANERRLLELINNYFDQAEVYRRIFVNLDHSREEMVKHQEVLVALGNHNSELAEKLTRSHLRRTAEKLTEYFHSPVEQTSKG